MSIAICANATVLLISIRRAKNMEKNGFTIKLGAAFEGI
jgi:hypothetical protein